MPKYFMPRRGARAAAVALGVGVFFAPAVHAQDAGPANPISFPDVPANHWAYQAVQDLADKGYVKGYPNGAFLGNRALTRYEFATVIDRMLQTLDAIKNSQTPPAAPQVTQDDLNKIQVLVDTFKQQLADIQTNVTQAQKDIEELRGEIADLRQDVLDAKDLAAKAQKTADNSYGFGGKRKFQISGYIQARYATASSSNQAEFPDGKAAAAGAYNGNYDKGGAGSTFYLRRSRIKFTGQLTENTKYAIQLDAGSGTTNAVTGKEGNITYTLGDGSARNVAFTAGLFGNPFGYILPVSQTSTIAAERPLGFSENGSAGGPFANQDFDRGVEAFYGPGALKYTAALISGTGVTNGVDNNRHVDQIYRVGYQSPGKIFGLGVSYYNGAYTVTGSSPVETGKKQLWDVDAQYISPAGPFLLGEYYDGKFPTRSYFASPAATSLTTDFHDGNKARAYYVQGGWTWGSKGVHPLTAAASWDVFDRSYSGAPGSGSAYRDENWGYGVLYNLDAATRLKFWYTKPQEVAHAAGTAEPDKIGLFTTELQVKF